MEFITFPNSHQLSNSLRGRTMVQNDFTTVPYPNNGKILQLPNVRQRCLNFKKNKSTDEKKFAN